MNSKNCENLEAAKTENTLKEENTLKTKSNRQTRKQDTLNSRGLELFEQLRDLRAVLAKEEKVPSYIVFPDKSLMDMCIKVPLDKEEMLKVSGVGENKYEMYGEQFLRVICEYTGGVHEKLYCDE